MTFLVPLCSLSFGEENEHKNHLFFFLVFLVFYMNSYVQDFVYSICHLSTIAGAGVVDSYCSRLRLDDLLGLLPPVPDPQLPVG